MALRNRLLKKIINSPIILKFGQDFQGVNQYKLSLYQQAFSNTGGSLLDFGCSYGNTTQAFLNFEYHGVDINKEAIHFARCKYENYPNVHFHNIDILNQGFKRNYFDHVLFASTSHHLDDDEFQKTLDVLLEQLKPAGQLHYFDIFQKPDDKWSTKLLTRYDQGKFIRRQEKSEAFFEKYLNKEVRVYPSPEKLIKLQDFLYVKLTR